ncbi:MAG: hypothetical protein CMF64_02380 [Magnetovibrio sp.]|nr:hypothetical protein [Magnetovibrio sp.]
MSILGNFVATAIEEIRSSLSDNQKADPTLVFGAADVNGLNNFAPADGAAAGDATLALRSSNEEPRSGSGNLLPGTAHPGPGTHPIGFDPVVTPAVEVFIDTDDTRGILGDVDWDVLAGGDAAVRIMGNDGQLSRSASYFPSKALTSS